MFERSGEKIKKVSTTVFYINLAIAMIVVIIAIFSGGMSTAMPLLIVAAIIVMLAWISSLFLYAFGDLVESNQRILELLQGSMNQEKTQKLTSNAQYKKENSNEKIIQYSIVQLIELFEMGKITKEEFLSKKKNYWDKMNKSAKDEKELNKIKSAVLKGLITNYEYEIIYDASKTQ